MKKGRVLEAEFTGHVSVNLAGCEGLIRLIVSDGPGKLAKYEDRMVGLTFGDFQAEQDGEAILALQIALQCRTILEDRLKKEFKKIASKRRWKARGL